MRHSCLLRHSPIAPYAAKAPPSWLKVIVFTLFSEEALLLEGSQQLWLRPSLITPTLGGLETMALGHQWTPTKAFLRRVKLPISLHPQLEL